VAGNKHYGTEREDVLSSDRATSENGVALQKRAAKLDVLRVKQATAGFPLERRRGSTVPPAPPLLMFTPTVEYWASRLTVPCSSPASPHARPSFA
jgi:hypothetical protein